MANPEHLKILERSVKAWNKWRKNIKHDISANLFDSYRVDLSGVDLSGAQLSEVDLHGVKLIGANLIATDLSGADLSGADLIGVDFSEANLSRTDLSRADLRGAVLSKANLHHATFFRTSIVDCNLNGAINIESCRHEGWSTVDHRTLVKSGNLPLSFLRGCGLPDFIIDNINIFQENPITFYSCFISYSSKDEEFANRLYADLQNKGIRCWYAPEKMKGGKKIYDQVNEAIRLHDKLLLVLSEDSMKSEWVASEIKKARAREKQEKRQMLFPIGIVPYEKIREWELFDADTGSDLAAVIREYHIPDFSEWKDHDSYKKGSERLIKDLKGEVTKEIIILKEPDFMRMSGKEKMQTAKQVIYGEISPWLKDHVENSVLVPRSDALLRRWLFDNETYEKIGIDYKLSRERVRQIIDAAVLKIKEEIRREKRIEKIMEQAANEPERFDYDVGIFSNDAEHADPVRIRAILMMEVRDCGFSVRALNSMMAADICTVEDILKKGKEGIVRLGNFNVKSRAEIDNFLKGVDLKWSGDKL